MCYLTRNNGLMCHCYRNKILAPATALDRENSLETDPASRRYGEVLILIGDM